MIHLNNPLRSPAAAEGERRASGRPCEQKGSCVETDLWGHDVPHD